jgi:hypothetical protein
MGNHVATKIFLKIIVSKVYRARVRNGLKDGDVVMKSRFKSLRFWLFVCIFLLGSFLLFWWMLEWHHDTLF